MYREPKLRRGGVRIGFGIFFCIVSLSFLAGISTVTEDVGDSTSPSSYAFIVIFYLTIGLLLLFFGVRAKRRYKKYKHYESIILVRNQTTINNISAETRDNPQKVMKTLLAMFQLGFFPGAYIDDDVKGIVFPREVVPTVQPFVQAQPFTQVQPSVQVQPITQKCSSCGANNTVVPGRVTECEYCGSPLK